MWTPACAQAFQTLQRMLVSPPIMNSPDPDLPFELATDASDVAVGAAPYQIHSEHGKRYIAFASRKLQGGQKNYSATKKELLAVIYGINKFHQYMYGRRFRILTDHRALTFALTQNTPTQMLQRWMDTLCNYDFTITHLPGISNILPDRLSRLYPHQPSNEQACSSTAETNESKSNSPGSIVTLHQLAREINGIDIPPESEREAILQNDHAKGHFGVDIMLTNLWKDLKVYWPGIRKQLVSKCEPCARYATARLGYLPLRTELPMDHIAIDTAQPSVTTPDGFNYILVIVDVCSRFLWLRKRKQLLRPPQHFTKVIQTNNLPN